MSLPIYQRVAVTDTGDVIPGAEYTVINENTGVAAPIYSDRTGATLLTAPYFADSAGTIQFFIAQGTTFRVAASGGVGTYTDRYVYGVAEAVLVDASGNVGIGVVPETWFPSLNTTALQIGDTTSIWSLTNGSGDLRTSLDSNLYIDASGNDKYLNTGPGTRYQQIAGEHRWSSAASGTADSTATVSDRMRLDSAGNLLVGTTTTNSAVAGHVIYGGALAGVSTQSAAARPLYINRLSSDGDIIELAKDDVKVGSIGSSNNAERLYITNDNTGLSFLGDFSIINPCDSAGAARDNAIDLGQSAARFNDAYITNGVTAGSDRTQKQDILEITKAEYNVAKACKGLLRSFRWIDAVEKKGDDARIHFGIMAQDLQDAFTAEGLDAGRYGMFMSNTWWETHTEVAAVEAVEGVEFVQAVEASEALYSEDGELISEAVEAVEGVEGVEAVEAKDAYTRTDTFYTLAEAPAGATERTRLGVRYTELLAFIIAAL